MRLPSAAIWACVAFTAVACTRVAERRQAVEAQLVKAEQQADAMSAAWRTVLASKPQVAIPAGAPPCPVPGVMPGAPGELKKRLGLEGANGPDLDKFMRNVAAAQADTGESSDLVIAPSQLAGAHSPRARMLAARAKRIRSELPHASGERLDALVKDANELAAPDFWTHDVVVIVKASSDSGGVDVRNKTFETRWAVGRSYVFSYGSKDVVCAGRFSATSSDTVEFVSHLGGGGEAYGAVDRDLRARILDQGKRALRDVNAGDAR